MARSMRFQINDGSTGGNNPAAFITITENADGTLSFSVTQEGGVIGDLRGLFFDVNAVADGTLANSLSIGGASAASTLKTGNDSVKDLGNGANMNGLTSSNGDGGFDAGINIGTSGIGADDIRSFSFTLSSSARALTLDDFANVDFGLRLTSVGTIGGARSDSSKLLETTSAAINAFDDATTAAEGAVVSANLLANDTNKLGTTAVTGWSGGTLGQAVALNNAAGATLTVNADGTYSLDASAADALSEGELLTYTFSYDASSVSSDQTSSDSASLTITVVGQNDGPTAGNDTASTTENAAAATGNVLSNDSDIDRLDTISVQSWNGGALGESAAITNGAGATVRLNGDGSYVVDASLADALSANETITQVFSYAIADNHGATATAELRVEVTGVNDGPDANDDAAGSMLENATLTGNVAGNDTDIDRLDTHNWAVVNGSFNGQGALTFNSDGSWSYDAQGAYDYLNAGQGVDLSFTYAMTDNNGASDTALVSFRVEGVGSAVQAPEEEEHGGPQGNNGFGNGDQEAPGGSQDNNNAENDVDPDTDASTGNGNGNGSGNSNGNGNGNWKANAELLFA